MLAKGRLATRSVKYRRFSVEFPTPSVLRPMGLVASTLSGVIAALVAVPFYPIGQAFGGLFWPQVDTPAGGSLPGVVTQSPNLDRPLWLRSVGWSSDKPTLGVCAPAPFPRPIEELTDAEVTSHLISAKLLGPTPGAFVSVAHGTQDLRSLLILLSGGAGFGPLVLRTALPSYGWLHRRSHAWLARIERLAGDIPIPAIRTDYYFVDKNNLGFVWYGELLQLIVHLYAYLYVDWFGADQWLPTDVPSVPLKYVPYNCCSGWGYSARSAEFPTRAAFEEAWRSYPVGDGVRSPQAYSSSSGIVIFGRSRDWLVGFAPNIYSPFAFALSGVKHGGVPLNPVPLDCFIPNLATARWPFHVTAWLLADDPALQGRISPFKGDPINGLFALRGAVLPPGVIGDRPSTWRTQIQWANRCPRNHCLHEDRECWVCAMLDHPSFVDASVYRSRCTIDVFGELDWAPVATARELEVIIHRFSALSYPADPGVDILRETLRASVRLDRGVVVGDGDGLVWRQTRDLELWVDPLPPPHDLVLERNVNFLGFGTRTYRCRVCALVADVGHHARQMEDIVAIIGPVCIG